MLSLSTKTVDISIPANIAKLLMPQREKMRDNLSCRLFKMQIDRVILRQIAVVINEYETVIMLIELPNIALINVAHYDKTIQLMQRLKLRITAPAQHLDDTHSKLLAPQLNSFANR
ncbi:hypothetical protein D3C80_1732590 [compost metagenome]